MGRIASGIRTSGIETAVWPPAHHCLSRLAGPLAGAWLPALPTGTTSRTAALRELRELLRRCAHYRICLEGAPLGYIARRCGTWQHSGCLLRATRTTACSRVGSFARCSFAGSVSRWRCGHWLRSSATCRHGGWSSGVRPWAYSPPMSSGSPTECGETSGGPPQNDVAPLPPTLLHSPASNSRARRRRTIAYLNWVLRQALGWRVVVVVGVLLVSVDARAYLGPRPGRGR
jgi:hypothetical protein